MEEFLQHAILDEKYEDIRKQNRIKHYKTGKYEIG